MAESLTKGGFTLTPKTGTGNAKVSISCSERTGRVDTSPVTFTAKMDDFSVSKSVSVVQAGKPEFVTVNNSAVAVDKKGGTVTITGVSNTSKLSFSCPDNEVTFSSYTANGAPATNGVAIAGDPGASAQFAFSIPVTISANTTASSKRYIMTVTTESEEVATVVFTQVASDFTYDLTLAASPTSIQAGGGTTTITGKYKTFRNDVLISTEDVTPTCSIPDGTAFALSGNKVTAPSRGTTAGELRSVTVSASYGNASSTITVSQAANQVESSNTTGGETIYNNVTAGAISNKTIPASGGSATATAGDGSQSWTTNKKYRHDTYTSGSVADVLIEDSKIGTDTIKPSVASVSGSAESKGTTVSGITTVKEQAVSWTGKGGKKATGTMYIYQAANAATDITYGVPAINSFTVDDIPASGGSISSGSVSYSQSRTQNYTSGATAQLSNLNSGGTITYSTAVSASSLGTSIKPRYNVGTLTVTVAMNGKSNSKDVAVYQAANHANYSDVSVSVTPNPVSIPAAGAIYNIKPTASQTASYTSGETKNCSISFSYAAKNTVTGFSNNNATVTVQQNLSTSPRNGFVVTVTASGEGSRTASVDVTFNQAAAAAYLNVDPATINIAADATSASFNIESNDSWTIS